MILAPLPHNEKQRLQALRDLLILDTPPEERFDRISAFAAKEFDVPMALVSLVDRDRQWFKSEVGMGVRETPIDASICAHAILGTQPLIVEDTYNDLRFHDNPVVINNPQIRFYAGQPLFSEEGQPLGTLCLIDPAPRQLSNKQLRLFIDMATLVEGYLKLRQLSAQTAQLRAALRAD